jgi:flagellar protein FliO/FliZ
MNWRAFGLNALAALALLTAPVRAEEATPAPVVPEAVAARTPAAYPIAPSGGSSQLAVYLLLLIALLGGGFYVMRNGFAFLQPKAKGPRKLDISETRMLGNRQFLIVAEYENRKMLLGVCPGRIEYLCTLAGAEPEFPQLPAEEEK